MRVLERRELRMATVHIRAWPPLGLRVSSRIASASRPSRAERKAVRRFGADHASYQRKCNLSIRNERVRADNLCILCGNRVGSTALEL